MNDFLKKLLAGLPTQNELTEQTGNSPAYEVVPNLDPSIYPSPLAYPEKLVQPEEVVQPQSKPTAIVKKAVPTTPVANMQTQNPDVPMSTQEEKKPFSLEDLLPKKQNDKELKSEQERANDLVRQLLFVKAGTKIAQSAYGAKADENLLNEQMALAQKSPQDLLTKRKEERDSQNQEMNAAKTTMDLKKTAFELGDKEKENDPNSDVSKAFREYAKSYVQGSGIVIDDRMSMADLQKTMGVIGLRIQAKMSMDARREANALARESKEQVKADKLDTKNMEFMERQFKGMKDSKNYKAAQAAESLSSLIEDGIRNPSAVKDIAATYEMVKTLDPESAVREGEVGLLQQGLSLRAKLESIASKASNNPSLYGSGQFLKAMKEYADFKKEVTRKLYDKEFNAVAGLAKRRGISDDDIQVMNPMPKSPSEVMPVQKESAEEIKRKTADGRIAIFDKNKKFLRYEE
jgi:hypothetical protein